MLTPDFFWNLFTSTGSISAYLMYRRLYPAPATRS
jgi:hypothetical protein